MKEIYIKKLLEFEKNNRKEILSKEEISSISSSSYSLYPYGTYNGKRVIDISLTENILFGLKSGILFTDKKCYYFFIHGTSYSVTELEYSELLTISFEKKLFGEKVVFKNFKEGFYKFEVKLLKKIRNLIEECDEIIKNKLKEENQQFLKDEEFRVKELNKIQLNVLNDFDKDGNGKVDLINGDDFNLLLRKHHNKIIEIDRNYIQEFVKISNYIKSKKENIQKIFDSIKNTPNEETLNNYVQILKDDIHSYNLLFFNSLNMIVSLVEDDMITFYEIHERFDNLNIFDSKHERDVSLKLSNIGDNLKELMFTVEEMGRNIEDQLSDLSYVTEQSSLSLNSQLEQIDSSLKTNNLLTTINTYQTYKLRD